jgi:ABC-type oligopeptide transport system substrate-binding subunit
MRMMMMNTWTKLKATALLLGLALLLVGLSSSKKTARQLEQELQWDGQELDSWLMERHYR